ncbi:mas-related G-protein coupled receptor member H-like [Cariama cristata]
MEPNRTPPPPTSPVPETDGDDLCRIDVTDMAIDGVTLLVCLIGLVGNGAVLWILVLRIRKNPITVYFRSLAFINFIFLLFMAISSLLYMIENASCSANLPTLSLSSLSQLSLFSYNTVAYLLTAISIERCVSILFPLWYRYRRPQYFSDVMCDLCWFFSIIFFAVATSLCLSHKHDLEHCRMALISMYVLNFLVFAPLMVISSTILFIKVLCASQQRQLRRLYIVIFLTVPLFIILEVPWNFQQQFSYTEVPSQVVFLLACINSSINPFIYFLVGSCRRRCSVVSLQVAFRRVFEEPEDNTARSNDIAMDTVASAS